MRLIRHTGIYVKDLERMRNFYCKYFNMEVAYHEVEKGNYTETVLGEPGIAVEIYKLSCADGAMIELLKTNRSFETDMHADRVVYSGCMHLAFTVKDLDRVYAEMQKEGIGFISKPVASEFGNVRVCFCRDPEGNYLELVENQQWNGGGTS